MADPTIKAKLVLSTVGSGVGGVGGVGGSATGKRLETDAFNTIIRHIPGISGKLGKIEMGILGLGLLFALSFKAGEGLADMLSTGTDATIVKGIGDTILDVIEGGPEAEEALNRVKEASEGNTEAVLELITGMNAEERASSSLAGAFSFLETTLDGVHWLIDTFLGVEEDTIKATNSATIEMDAQSESLRILAERADVAQRNIQLLANAQNRLRSPSAMEKDYGRDVQERAEQTGFDIPDFLVNVLYQKGRRQQLQEAGLISK